MKIECEVLSVETTGDGLKIGLQGKPPSAAEWRDLERQEIIIPVANGSAKTFYVGRRVVITVRPR
jgi:hypothetical protein